VIVDRPDESFSLPMEQEQQLLDAIDEVDRGEIIRALSPSGSCLRS